MGVEYCVVFSIQREWPGWYELHSDKSAVVSEDINGNHKIK